MARRYSRKRKRKTIRERIKGFFGKIGTLNIVLICVGVYMVYINHQMLTVYQMNGSAPETAWCALIGALLGECGICGWIKTSKEKHKKDKAEKEADEIQVEEPEPEPDFLDADM